MSVPEIVQRAYELEAERLVAGVRTLSWRLSEDVYRAIYSWANGREPSALRPFYLLGAPGRVDRSLPPMSIFCDGAPEVAP